MFEQHPNQTLSSRPYEVYDAVCPSTTTEPNGKEDQDAGNTNWKIMVFFLDFYRQENTMMTSETLTHFRGRDSRIEVPSCPRSFHGYWTLVINLQLKRYLVVTEWIQRTWMVNILLSSCCRKDKLSWFTCTHTPQWLTWNRHQTKLAEKKNQIGSKNIKLLTLMLKSIS